MTIMMMALAATIATEMATAFIVQLESDASGIVGADVSGCAVIVFGHTDVCTARYTLWDS